MFSTSETTAKLDAALAKAQGKIDAARKDATNPHFKSKYADLSAVWGAIRSALSESGISVTQWPVNGADDKMHLVTRLAHEGEWMMAEFSLPVSKRDAQGCGSALTYLRRYGLSAAVGVVADDDDDGNAASRKPEATPQLLKRDEARALFAELVRELRECTSVTMVDRWERETADEVAKLGDWKVHVASEITKHIEYLNAKAEAA